MEIPLWENGAPGYDAAAGQKEPSLTPYLVEGAKGVVIVCPGGGYTHLADHEGRPIAERLNEAGISAFVLRSRLAPYHYPAQLHDVQRAVRVVRAHHKQLGVAPDKIAVLGFSAGGHLAGMAATMYDDPDATVENGDAIDALSCRPDAAVLCYPVVSMIESCTHQGSCQNLTGFPDAPQEMRSRLSLERRVSDTTPPVFLWHTAEDDCVPVDNSLRFARAMHEKNRPFSLHIYPHGRHGLGLAAETPLACAWMDETIRWLKDLGF